jgi:hypothetical protein
VKIRLADRESYDKVEGALKLGGHGPTASYAQVCWQRLRGLSCSSALAKSLSLAR